MQRFQISLFTLVAFPALLVATNCLALSWLRYSNEAYFMNNVNVTSDIRWAGWPFRYNAAFINILDENKSPLYPASNSFSFHNILWKPLVGNVVIASIAATVLYWLLRGIRRIKAGFRGQTASGG